MWKFTCYNKTEFISYSQNINEAIEDFFTQTGLHQMDIKFVENMR